MNAIPEKKQEAKNTLIYLDMGVYGWKNHKYNMKSQMTDSPFFLSAFLQQLMKKQIYKFCMSESESLVLFKRPDLECELGFLPPTTTH